MTYIYGIILRIEINLVNSVYSWNYMHLFRKLLFCFLVHFTSAVCFGQARINERIVIVKEVDSVSKTYNGIFISGSNTAYVDNGSRYTVLDLKKADFNFWNPRRLDSLLLEHRVFPDIVLSENNFLVPRYVDSLNKVSYHKVNAIINELPLENVNWKELSKVYTTGEFISTSNQLSPKKRGFWFSPDVFNFSANNLQGAKVFKAFKYDLKEKLRISISYNENAYNTMSNDDVLTGNDLVVGYDKVRGKTASFNGKTSYIDVKTATEIHFKELSITAWIKPKTIEGALSIVGKGEVFSAKINNGYLQFTSPKIKDHFTKKIVVKPNEWIHIAYVYIPNDKMFFYVNGKLIEEQKAFEIDQTNHSVLIGTNLWGENYHGLMSDFNMWTRALSDDEVNEVYKGGLVSNGEVYSGYAVTLWTVGILLILIVGLILSKAVWGKKKLLNDRKSVHHDSYATSGPMQYHVQCLGGFKILSKDFEDISHKFSPKRRELFLLILLYTLREGGITSKKLGAILWPNFSPSNVKNNRSTQIREIRNIFENYLNLDIVYSDKKWKVMLGEDVKVDIVALQKMMDNIFRNKSKVTENAMPNIVQLINQGTLLPNIEVDWLDELKGQYGNVVLDSLIPFLETKETLSKNLLLDLSNAILIVDPLHEQALKVKLEVLTAQGKHMSVKKEIENFMKLYEKFYREPYSEKLI